MMPMMHYKKWDVLVTTFPFADDARSKKRPVLCVASFHPTKDIELYWVLMVTSTKLKGWQGDIEVHDLKRTGLPVPSIVRTTKIACVDASLIEKKAGVLDATTKEAVRRMLQDLFA